MTTFFSQVFWILKFFSRIPGVAKRCRLSWQTNSALVFEPKGGGSGGLGGLSQWEQLCKRSPINFGNPTPYLTYGGSESQAFSMATRKGRNEEHFMKAGLKSFPITFMEFLVGLFASEIFSNSLSQITCFGSRFGSYRIQHKVWAGVSESRLLASAGRNFTVHYCVKMTFRAHYTSNALWRILCNCCGI